MKEVFIVAQNAFTVSVSDNLPVWETLGPRYRLFTGSPAEKPVLEVDIKAGQLPKSGGERIYEPADPEAGLIAACASRISDGCLIMEFRHVAEAEPRVCMKMPPELNRAEIVIAPYGDESDPYFLNHALMIAFMLATSINGTLLIHASAVLFRGNVYLFQGKSGTGKSTHASLWTRNIIGTELLNDDHPVLRFSADGTAVAYGSPWSGKTHCYRNIAAPIGAFVRIVRDKDNNLRQLTPLRAYASLTTSVFYMPFVSEELRETRHKTIERLVESVPCYEMHCRPDADAAFTCMRGLLTHSKN